MGSEAEGASPEQSLDRLLARTGQVWPRSDEQLDTWLAEQPLADEERSWLKEVVRVRMSQAAGDDPQPAEGSPDDPDGYGSVVESVSALHVSDEELLKGAKPAAAELAEPAAELAPQPEPRAAPRATPRPEPRRLAYEDLALLNRELMELVQAGVPLPRGLAAYAQQLKDGGLERVLTGLRGDLEGGLPLSQALERRGDALPPIYRALVAAGEEAGDLTPCLALLHEQAQVDAELDQRVREAMVYPALTTALVVGSMGFLAFFIAPYFERLWGEMGIQLPFLTQAFLGLSSFLRENLLLMIPLVLGGGWGLTVAVKRWVPSVARGVLGRYARLRGLSELSRALAGFVSRGVPLDRAFRSLRDAYPALPSNVVDEVVGELEGGARLSEALRGHDAVFPPTYVWLLGAAEERGTLAQTLGDLARRYEHDFKRRLKLLEIAVGPIALLGVGLLVGLSALTIYLPLFTLQKSLMY